MIEMGMCSHQSDIIHKCVYERIRLHWTIQSTFLLIGIRPYDSRSYPLAQHNWQVSTSQDIKVLQLRRPGFGLEAGCKLKVKAPNQRREDCAHLVQSERAANAVSRT
jgi:hypothetical protein